ncbi:MAG TPA: alanine racemase [Myxococcota bacterium]|nr:alanine racemase [Myxococcota bacterium]
MSSVGAPGPVVARIDLGALRANWAVLRAAAGRARLFAVVKADAYGHGAPAVARTLRDAGCDAFAVARVSELAVLRDAGLEGEVLVLGGTVDAAEADAALALGATLALHHEEHVALAAAAARRRSVCAAVHLEVDTGMRRMGVCSDDLPRLVARVAAEPSLRLAGVFTHFARADEPGAPEADAQLARFSAALEAAKLPRDGSLLVHAANSAGILAGARLGAALPEANAARPGLALYGVSPFGTSDGRASALRPVMTLAARVVQTRRLARGDAVGYGSTWRAERPTTVATVAAGYADGVPWALGNRGAIALRGRRLPIVGRVSMDFVTVDAGDAPAALGDEAVLFGEAEAGAISASEVAAAAGTIPYEILSRVAPRVPRVLVSDGGPRRPA